MRHTLPLSLALTDPARTRLVLVARPQPSALTEIERTFSELTAIGMSGRLRRDQRRPSCIDAGDEPIASAVCARREAAALSSRCLPQIADLPRDVLELKEGNVVGFDALRAFFGPDRAPTRWPADEADAPGPAGCRLWRRSWTRSSATVPAW